MHVMKPANRKGMGERELSSGPRERNNPPRSLRFCQDPYGAASGRCLMHLKLVILSYHGDTVISRPYNLLFCFAIHPLFIQAVKVFSTVFIGFFFSLFTTTFSVLGLRKLQGTAVDAPVEVAAAPAAGPAPKAFSDEMMDFMLKGTVLSGAISIAASKTGQAYKVPLQTIFMGFATFTSFIWGARMPAAVTKFLHPILTSTGMTFLTAQLIGMATGSSFVDILKEYKCGSLGALTAGAGDLILYMLGPAVISFAIAMYSRKGVIASNLPTVTTGVVM